MTLIGRRFLFAHGHITFLGEGMVTTSWGDGYYVEITHRVYNVCWNGYNHRFTFNADYTWYYSIRIEPFDLDYTHGSWVDPPPSSPWVSCQLAGGIGNRLFQLAAALGLAERLKRRVVFYRPVNTGLSHQSSDHIYSLFPEIQQVDAEDSMIVYEPDGKQFSYTLQDLATEKNILLFGYRQHMQYFPSYSICPSFPSYTIPDVYKLGSGEEKRISWFIHVRLGDYLNYNELNHITVDSYHQHIICKIPQGANILVFSNEPERAMAMLQGVSERNFTLCDEIDECKSLFLMSQCWGGAIAVNSTFSWWGSYFAYHSTPYKWDYKAYFPKQWKCGVDGIIDAPWGNTT
jgi:hypothetical protein